MVIHKQDREKEREKEDKKSRNEKRGGKRLYNALQPAKKAVF